MSYQNPEEDEKDPLAITKTPQPTGQVIEQAQFSQAPNVAPAPEADPLATSLDIANPTAEAATHQVEAPDIPIPVAPKASKKAEVYAGYPVSSSNDVHPEVSAYLKKHPEVAGMAWGGGENDSDPTEPRSVIVNESNQFMSDPVKRKGLLKIEAARHKMSEADYKPGFTLTPSQQEWRKGLGEQYATNDDAIKKSIVSRLIVGDDVPDATPEQLREAERFGAILQDEPAPKAATQAINPPRVIGQSSAIKIANDPLVYTPAVAPEPIIAHRRASDPRVEQAQMSRDQAEAARQQREAQKIEDKRADTAQKILKEQGVEMELDPATGAPRPKRDDTGRVLFKPQVISPFEQDDKGNPSKRTRDRFGREVLTPLKPKTDPNTGHKFVIGEDGVTPVDLGPDEDFLTKKRATIAGQEYQIAHQALTGLSRQEKAIKDRMEAATNEAAMMSTSKTLTPDQQARLKTIQDSNVRDGRLLSELAQQREPLTAKAQQAESANLQARTAMLDRAKARWQGGDAAAGQEVQKAIATEPAASVIPTIQQAAQPEPPTMGAKLYNALGAVIKGIADVPASVLDAASIAGLKAYNSLPEWAQNIAGERRGIYSPKQSLAGQGATMIRNLAKSLFPDNAQLQNDFVYNQVPQGLGSALGFMTGGLVSKSKYLMPAFLGVTSGMSSGYDDAIQHGATEDEAFKSAMLNGGVGISEILPISGMLDRFDKASGGTLKKGILHTLKEMGKHGAKEGFEEVIQETFQNVAGNKIAKEIYDKDRGLFDGVGEQAAAAGASGFLLSAIVTAASGAKIKLREKRDGAQAVELFNKDHANAPGFQPLEAKDAPILKAVAATAFPESFTNRWQEAGDSLIAATARNDAAGIQQAAAQHDGLEAEVNQRNDATRKAVTELQQAEPGLRRRLVSMLSGQPDEATVDGIRSQAPEVAALFDLQRSNPLQSNEPTIPAAETPVGSAGATSAVQPATQEKGQEGQRQVAGAEGANAATSPSSAEVLTGDPELDALVSRAKAIQPEGVPSVAKIQRSLGLGYTQAFRIQEAIKGGQAQQTTAPAPDSVLPVQRETPGQATGQDEDISRPAGRSSFQEGNSSSLQPGSEPSSNARPPEQAAPASSSPAQQSEPSTLEDRESSTKTPEGKAPRTQESGQSQTSTEITSAPVEEKPKRSSTQVNLDKGPADAVRRLGKTIDPADIYDSEEGHGLEDEPHVTALYGLDADVADPVKKAIAGIGPIKAKFGKASIFSNDKYDVLKFDVDSPDLHRLNAELKKLPHSSDFPDYQPHITVAYLKKGTGQKYAGAVPGITGRELTFDTLKFSDKDRNKTDISLGESKPVVITGYHAGKSSDPVKSWDASRLGSRSNLEDSKIGFFFSRTENASNNDTYTGSTGVVHPYQLSLKSPYRTKETIVSDMMWKEFRGLSGTQVRDKLLQQGYDSIITGNNGEIVVLKPESISTGRVEPSGTPEVLAGATGSPMDRARGLVSNAMRQQGNAAVLRDLRIQVKETTDPTSFRASWEIKQGQPDYLLNINHQRIAERTAGMSEKEARDYVESAISEEIVHFGQFEAVRRDWQKQGRRGADRRPQAFEQAFAEQYRGVSDAMTPEEISASRDAYGDQELNGPALGAEFVRQMIQAGRAGQITEATIRAKPVIDRILKVLKDILDRLQNAPVALQRAYERTKAVLDEIEGGQKQATEKSTAPAESTKAQEPKSTGQPAPAPKSKPQQRKEGATSSNPATPTTAAPADTLSALNTAKQLKITAPKGATFLRITPTKGAAIVERVDNVGKGANILIGAGPFTKIEAGTMAKGGVFSPMAGEVIAEDRSTPKPATLSAKNVATVDKPASGASEATKKKAKEAFKGLFSAEPPSNPFYSQLTRTVEQLPQQTMTVAQARAAIQKGAKPDEIAASGILEDPLSPLAGRPDNARVTKSELTDYAVERQTRVKDFILSQGGNKQKITAEYLSIADDLDNIDADNFSDFDDADEGAIQMGERAEEYIREASEALRAGDIELAKQQLGYAGQLERDYGDDPTTKSLRKRLEVASEEPEDETHFGNYQLPGADEGSYREMFVTWPEKSDSTIDSTLAEVGRLQDEGKWDEARKLGSTIKDGAKNWTDGHSQYGDIKNPVVRIRRNLRTDADGRTTYFIEEMQGPGRDEQEKMPEAVRKRIYEIGMKRAIRDAVDSGADAIGWTTGEQQVERYDLSKSVKHLEYHPSTQELYAYDHGNNSVHEGKYPPEKLQDVIGKDAANKLLAQEKDEDGRLILEGDELKVGGEGLKRLYDSTLPRIANKLAEKVGGKVTTGGIVDEDAFTTESYSDFLERTGLPTGTTEERVISRNRYDKERRNVEPKNLEIHRMAIPDQWIEKAPEFALYSSEPVEQKPLPKDRRAAFFDLADSLEQDGIKTPEQVARFLDEISPNLRPYAQSLWDTMGAAGAVERGTHDWAKIFGDNVLQRKSVEQSEEVGGPKTETETPGPNQRPSLGSTVDEVISGWKSAPRMNNEAVIGKDVAGGTEYQWGAGDRLQILQRSGNISGYRDATPQDELEMRNDIANGVLQIERQQVRGLDQKLVTQINRGKTNAVLHQATGSPLSSSTEEEPVLPSSNDQPPGSRVEPDRGAAGTRDSGGEGGISSESGSTDQNGEPVDGSGEESRNTEPSGPLSADVPSAPHRTGSDQPISERESGTPERVAGDEQSDRSGRPDAIGVAPERPGKSSVSAPLVVPSSPGTVEVGGGSGSNFPEIRRSARALTEEQAGDVAFIEKRLIGNGKPGVLLTNGTGTGKTFSGLGAVKRMLDRGAKHILIVTPTDPISNVWVSTAKQFFGINDAKQLDGITDNGTGSRVVATTYANLYQNDSLVKRPWDAVVADESHYLSQSEDGTVTQWLEALRALTQHPDGDYRRATMELPEAATRIEAIKKIIKDDPKSENRGDLSDELSRLADQLSARRQQIAENRPAEKDRPKVVMLSASPFSYHFSLDYASGYLYDLPKENQKTVGRYNHPSARSQFYMENLGWRMKNGKLTRPENATATSILERRLAEKFMKDGAMAGRSLQVPFDYSRDFVVTESALGTKIDEIMDAIHKDPNLHPLLEHMGVGDYLERRFLLEALKARESVDRIKKHLAMGRKVVLFHDYKKGGAGNPLRPNIGEGQVVTVNTPAGPMAVNLSSLYESLRNKVSGFDETVKALDRLASPLVYIQRSFPNVIIYNGDIDPKKRPPLIAKFNAKGYENPIILVQRQSGKEGISLHDTSGDEQRVFMDLGIPGRPTDAIQSEGRIYRTGVKSNAVDEYLTTGTNFERWTFAQTIAQRASTAENLAMGERARNLLQSFSTGYNDAAPMEPHRAQGTGGKAMDRARDNGNPYANAVALYYTNQKKTSRNKASEAIDYFATPEPLGFKMVEWANIRPGEKVLEPSAGHGAIARFFPDSTNRHAIEPSNELAGRLALNATDTEIHETSFENYHIANKFDAVVMNPPFGTAGKTAMDHLIKATGHLREGGRLVALIPMGSSMEKRFDAWMEGDGSKGIHMAGEVKLPSVAFERAGTSVSTRVVILDKNANATGDYSQIDLTNAENTKDFFDRLENIGMKDRPPLAAAQPRPIATREAVLPAIDRTIPVPTADSTYAPADFKHTKTGKPVFVAKIERRMNDVEYKAELARAKKRGGYYSSFRGAGAIPGFHFNNAEERDSFIGGGDQVSGLAAPEPDASSGPEGQPSNTNVEQLKSAIAALPEIERKVLVARSNGQSNEEVAKALSIPPAGAERAYRQAIGKLRAARAQTAAVSATFQRALSEKEGERTIGRPDLANPGKTEPVRRMIDAIDEERGKPETRKDSDVIKEVDDKLAADYEGEKKRVFDLAKRVGTGGLNDVDTAIAKRIIDREGFEAVRSGDPDALYRQIQLTNAFRFTGTEQARAFRQRRDLTKTPAERQKAYVLEALFTPPKTIRDKVDKADDTERERLLRDWTRQMNRVKKQLKDLGLDLENMTDAEISSWLADKTRASAAIRTISTAKADKWDALYEYWISSILSAPPTQVANAVGNTAHSVWDFTAQRMAESIVNLAVGDKNSAQLGEFAPMIRAFLPGVARGAKNFMQSLRTETPTFEEEVLGQHGSSKIEDNHSGPAIEGTKGRIIRLPLRMLLAVDEFSKSVVGQMQAAAVSYRLAKAEGLSGAAMTSRIDALMSKPNSIAWQEAVTKADELSFQQDMGGLGNAVVMARNSTPGLRYQLPFIKTVANIFKTGIRKTPLGSAALLYRMSRQGAVSLNWDSKSGYRYTPKEFVPHAAEQLLAWGMLFALRGLVEPGDDDLPTITGTSPYTPSSRGQRDLAYRTAPPMSVRIGKDWHSYSRIEPFATGIGVMIDALNKMRDARNGEENSAAIGDYMSHVLAMVKDKTFLRGIADFLSAIEDPASMTEWAGNFATSWVPNIIRAGTRETDDVMREQKLWGRGDEWTERLEDRLKYKALPIAANAPEPKVDLWGREIEKDKHSPGTDWLWRMTLPSRTQKGDSIMDIDRALLKWNNTNPNAKFAPQPPAPSWQKTINGKQHTFYMSDSEYHDMLVMSGKMSVARIQAAGIDYENPKQADLEKISDAISKSRKQAREILWTQRVSRALGNPIPRQESQKSSE